MLKPLLAMLPLLLAINGCDQRSAASPAPQKAALSPVAVQVDKNGELVAAGFWLTPANLPAFVQETHGRPITIKAFSLIASPEMSLIDFDKATAAKKQLQDAGAANVTIDGISGE